MRIQIFYILLMNATVLFFTNVSLAQDVNLAWVGAISGYPNDIEVDNYGNVYTVGYFSGTVDFDPGPGISSMTSNGQLDIFVHKFDANGNFLWVRTFGGSSDDNPHYIISDDNDNVYITGKFQDTVDFDPGVGVYPFIAQMYASNVFILKLDSSGDLVWVKSLEGSDIAYGTCLAFDLSGNICLTGSFRSGVDFDPGPANSWVGSSGSGDVFVLKLDTQGDFIWVKTFGGQGQDTGVHIAIDDSDNIYVAGDFAGTTDFDPGAGVNSLSSSGQADVFIQKLDSNGNFIWVKSFGDTLMERCLEMTLDASSNIYLTGYYDGSVDFDPGLGTFMLSTNGYDEIYVQKLNSEGDFLWAKSMGGIHQDWGYSLITDNNGNVFITGAFAGTVDFDPGSGVLMIAAESNDAFLQKLDDAGDLLWCETFGGIGGTTGTSVTIDASGVLYLTGKYYDSVDFDLGLGTNFLESNQGDAFVVKLFEGSASLDPDLEIEFTCTLFPNPSSGNFKMEWEGDCTSVTVQIKSLSGNLIYQGTSQDQNLYFSIDGVTSGMYIVEIITDTGIHKVEKLIIQ